MTKLTHTSREVSGNVRLPGLMVVSKVQNLSETPSDRFMRLSTSRVGKTLESIRLLGNLANRANYGYTDKQVDELLKALLQAIVTLERQFQR